MTSLEAKQMLGLYRPGSADATDPQVAAALAQVGRDPDLRRWFEQHCAVQTALRKKFRQIPIPPGLAARVCTRHKVVPLPAWWQRPPAWLAAAASIVLLATLAFWWFQPSVPDRFSDYRARMVQTVLRQYRMDIITNNMTPVRQFLAAKGAPADYTLPKGLTQLQLTGGGFLRWRSHAVSMVCFDRGDQEMLYLFVMDRSATDDPPPDAPQLNKVNKLLTVSWTRADKTYVLAGPEEPGFPSKYL